MSIERRRETESLPLPPYRAVIAVDAEKFSRNTDRGYQILGQAIPQVLADAFERSGLEHVWQDARFTRHSGDGYVLGTEPQFLPYLIHPFLDTLHEELRKLQPRLAFADRSLRLRLRVSIEVGPLPDTDGESHIDAMGEAMVQVHRLLDAEPVRQALASSNPEATLLAAIVSRRVYEDAVLSGFGGTHRTRFRPVNVSIPDKEYTAEGYLYVPVPSLASDPLSAAGAPASGRDDRSLGPAHRETAQSPPTPVTNTFSNAGNAENIVQTTTFNGGIHSSSGRKGR